MAESRNRKGRFTMPVTAIITEDGIDQIIQMEGPGTVGAAAIIRREVRDLRNMGCTVKTRVFPDEQAAYDWEEKRR